MTRKFTPQLEPIGFTHLLQFNSCQNFSKTLIQNNIPSSRRTPGPRLSTVTQAESLGPDFRRDDGRNNEINAMIVAKMAAKMCASDSQLERVIHSAAGLAPSPAPRLPAPGYRPPGSGRSVLPGDLFPPTPPLPRLRRRHPRSSPAL